MPSSISISQSPFDIPCVLGTEIAARIDSVCVTMLQVEVRSKLVECSSSRVRIGRLRGPPIGGPKAWCNDTMRVVNPMEKGSQVWRSSNFFCGQELSRSAEDRVAQKLPVLHGTSSTTISQVPHCLSNFRDNLRRGAYPGINGPVVVWLATCMWSVRPALLCKSALQHLSRMLTTEEWLSSF